ncbi:unnamed protein product [Gongylonema pulchrum]|uniref:Eukaryotic translation initiation factor 6 n=1 Tax=Gongylonema pulchrum TaxID=637853 RepID=A0A183EZQ3_9BILA|nr:unnamed protein product [Gongylonema pulchrum]
MSVVESELADVIPVIHCSIAGTRIVGRVTAGNRKGLLVPNATTDQELQHIRNSLPDNVKIRRVDEKLSALGNVIACNDHVALVHPEISKETTQVCSDFFRFFHLIGIRLKYLSLGRLDFSSESSSIMRICALISFSRKLSFGCVTFFCSCVEQERSLSLKSYLGERGLHFSPYVLDVWVY